MKDGMRPLISSGNQHAMEEYGAWCIPAVRNFAVSANSKAPASTMLGSDHTYSMQASSKNVAPLPQCLICQKTSSRLLEHLVSRGLVCLQQRLL